MNSDDILEVARSQGVSRAAVQAEVGVAVAEGKHERANMFRTLQTILEDAEANPGVLRNAKVITPSW